MTQNKTTLFAAHIKEVEDKIKKAAKGIASDVGEQKRAYYSTANHVLGLTSPQQKQLLKEGYSFSKQASEEQLLIWDAVWRYSRYHESKGQALLWIASIKDTSSLKNYWTIISKWVDHVDSWDSSDTLSSVFTRILEDAVHVLYPVLQKWNISKNPWHRRQSIVSLLYYSSSRRIILPHDKILSLVENLIGDTDKFVQKGVGWTLRECYSVHPLPTKRFIRKHATNLSAIAFSAASEKWPQELSDEIKTKRKAKRK